VVRSSAASDVYKRQLHGHVAALFLAVDPCALNHAHHLSGVVIEEQGCAIIQPGKVHGFTSVSKDLVAEVSGNGKFRTERELYGALVFADLKVSCSGALQKLPFKITR
jgi:hypothetical protein